MRGKPPTVAFNAKGGLAVRTYLCPDAECHRLHAALIYVRSEDANPETDPNATPEMFAQITVDAEGLRELLDAALGDPNIAGGGGMTPAVTRCKAASLILFEPGCFVTARLEAPKPELVQ